MEIRTGYFSYTKRYKELGYYCISIARFTPKFYNGDSFIDLAPSAILLNKLKNGYISEEEFTDSYINQLKYLDFNLIIEEFNNLAIRNNAKGIVLLCFEKVGNFCHRNVLASYLNENFNLNVSEIII